MKNNAEVLTSGKSLSLYIRVYGTLQSRLLMLENVCYSSAYLSKSRICFSVAKRNVLANYQKVDADLVAQLERGPIWNCE